MFLWFASKKWWRRLWKNCWHDYTTGNLLDYASYKKHYRLIAIDLSKQTKLIDPLQINFIGKLLRNTGATMFVIIEKSEQTTFNFSQNSVTIV